MSLFPQLAGLRLEQVVLDGEIVRLHLAASARRARCPRCARRSKRVHSHYHRTIADLPLAGRRLVLRLRVRRFRCDVRRCSRAIFAERFPHLVATYGRRTLGQRAALEVIAFALGGSAGARLATHLGSPVSRATLLRVLRRADVPRQPAPRVLGIDDWAFRKGHRYGTILVDLERRRIVDLLEDRKAETLAPWLSQFPGLEVISRDRAAAYAEAARTGAPQAVQVIDRWHLIQNLVEALERCLLRFRPALKVATGVGDSILGPLTGPIETTLVPWRQRAEAASQEKHATKVERYEQMRTLREAGFTVLDIAQIVGTTRPTVYRYLALGGPPERQRSHRSARRVLAPYEPYLIQRWAEGLPQSLAVVPRDPPAGVPAQRQDRLPLSEAAQRRAAVNVHRSAIPPYDDQTALRRHVASLLVWRKERLPEEERNYLRRLCDQEPMIARAHELAQEFVAMARERTGQGFDAWLTRATASEITELDRFARGLTDDRAAVEAGLSQQWSNGQTEGQVNKLKLLKRQMYGRANFDLLRQRMLRAA